ncbi:MAG TPA: LuxR C-terminal-related transcriptional regulator [Amycolatopsis sp.]|nr:LuxR C-terminal-related transcriptional regulator [Amycolatopsis sp.]
MKIVAPFVPANSVRREELWRSLAGVMDTYPVTMICAPAGYGKTSLLAEWIAETGAADKAWVCADGSDNDADRFFAAILGAFRECGLVPAGHALRSLEPPAGVEVTDFVAELADAIETLPGRIHLVLDDAHEIVAPHSRHTIELLIRHQPANLRLVLATRSDPPLPLARLRLQGKLGELRARQLRLSEQEADTMLRDAGVVLDSVQVSRLVEKTGGWAAGLRLAARSLRDTRDRTAFVTEFTGDDRAVADYLVSEVLARLPERTREFLLAVSVCDEVHPALGTALSGCDDAAEILADLEQAGSLVVRTGAGQGWYRLHPLLRSYLQAEVRRRDPRLVAGLHAAAASWLAAEGMLPEALSHATESEAPAAIAGLLGRHGLTLLLGGRNRTVARALRALGRDGRAGNGSLSTLSALAHLEAGELADARADLAAAAPAEDAEGAALRYLIESACALAAGERTGAPPADVRTPGLAAWAQLDRAWRLLGAGRPHEARAEAVLAEELARDYGADYVAMHSLVAQSVAAWLDGEYVAMMWASRESLALARAHGWSASPWLALSRLTQAFGHFVRAEPDEAVTALRGGGPSTAALQPGFRYVIDVIEALCGRDCADPAVVARKLRAARGRLGEARMLPAVAAVAALAEYRCVLRLGLDVVGRELFVWTHAHTGPVAEIYLMKAWQRFAVGDIGGVREALGTAARSKALLPLLTQLEVLLLSAAVALRTDSRTLAIAALGEALRLAEPGRVVRPFAEADRSVRQLLVDQLGGFDRLDGFAHEVSRSLSTADSPDAADILTSRESDVLEWLASPQSLEELAVSLSVSVNTVKTHVRAIYTKLGVSSRRAAVTTARERGLA